MAISFLRSALAMLCLASASAAQAQSTDMLKTAPIVGGTTATETAPKFGGDFLQPAKRHTSALGMPCLTVNAYSRAQIINPENFDNVVILKNGCPNAIDLTICYLGTTHCITPKVPGYTRREATLGATSSTKDFRFEYRESFK
ncbi:MAG: hypothetical protein EKK33_33725 [Bradyrhizobiaceae bacterium]|nr:MAG: hypothetical protein EKK33_33725 [Bradyrhizobiaceae bacterium]